MLTAAFSLLSIAVLAGSVLAVLHMRENAALPPLPWGLLHAATALAGLVLLAIAISGPVHGLRQGTAGFGAAAAALLVFAALLGAALLAARLRRGKVSDGLIGMHAMIAISGFVVLMAYYFAG